jgi:hypothetical protein
MIHETHEKHKKKLKEFVLIRVIRGLLFSSSPGEARIMRDCNEYP